jgi:hypothetical protein
VNCPYFHLEFRRDFVPFHVGGMRRMQLLIPVQGHGTLTTPNGIETLAAGQVWLLPADSAAELCQPGTTLACLVCTLPD